MLLGLVRATSLRCGVVYLVVSLELLAPPFRHHACCGGWPGVAPGLDPSPYPASAGTCSHAPLVNARLSLSLFLLVASFFLRASLCFSAQASQRVWFGIACPRQCRQIPSSLALSCQSLAAFLAASLYSGGRCLGPSRSLCSSGVFLTSGREAFLGGLGFGSDLALVFPGFPNRRRSPGFSSVGVDGGLFAGSYSPLNLAGSGTRSRKVAPTARFCGGWRQPGRRRHRPYRWSGALGRRGGIRLPRRLRQPGPGVGDPRCGRAGLWPNVDPAGAGRRRSRGGPNLPRSTDTATTETGITPTACPLPDTGQRTGGRACTGQRPPPGTHRRATVPVLLGRVHGRGASQVQGPQPRPCSSGR